MSSQDHADVVTVHGKKYSDVAVLEYHGLDNVLSLIFAFWKMWNWCITPYSASAAVSLHEVLQLIVIS